MYQEQIYNIIFNILGVILVSETAVALTILVVWLAVTVLKDIRK